MREWGRVSRRAPRTSDRFGPLSSGTPTAGGPFILKLRGFTVTVISTLLRRLQKARSFRPGCPLPARTRLHVTLLEDRTVPTTLTWIGGAMSNNDWSTSGNWSDGAANTEVPDSADDVLVFDGTASTFTSNNDISSLTVSDIQLSFSGYTITGSQPVTVNTAVTDTTTVGSNAISLSIDGTAVLTKSGGSILFLSGTNTFTGATTVSGGVLELGGGAAVADLSAVTVSAGATLNLDANETIGSLAGAGNVTLSTFTLTAGGDNTSTTFSGVASGTGGLTKAGTGTLTLTGSNTYTGATTVSAGTLTLNGGTALDDTSAVTVAAGATLDLGASETIGSLAGAGDVTLGANTLTAGGDNTSTTFSGVASGTGGLTKAGTGTLTLSGTNTYTGATTVSAGTLALSGNTAIADAAAVTVSTGATLALNNNETIGSLAGAGNVTLGANFLTAGADNTSTTFSGVISGTGTLTKQGTGTLTLSGANTYTGATTVSAGTLTLNGGTALANTSAVTVSAGATLNLGASETIGSLAGAGNVTLSTFTLTAGGDGTSTTFSGVASGTGGLTKAGNGTLTLSGANTYTGATTATAGSLALNGGSALANTSALTVDAAAVLFLGASETIGSLAGAGSLSIGAFTLTTGGDNTSTTFSGGIGGSGGVTKTGTGTLTLSGTTNNFSGPTTVSAGTLALSGGSALDDTSAVTVAAGATLDVGANETIGSLAGAGNVTLGANTLTAGGDNSSTTFSGIAAGTGGLTKAGSGTLTLSGANTYTGLTTVSAGTLTLAGNSAIADTAAVTVSGGATLALGADEIIGSLAGAGNVTLGVNFLTAGGDNTSTTFSGVIGGTGTLTKAGSGTLTLSGANTYTGTTTVADGTLLLSGGAALDDANAVTVSFGAILALVANETIGSLAGNGTVDLSTFTLTAGGDGTSTTFSGIAAGTGGLTKAGTGTLTLSGANAYTGATTVSGGTLSITDDTNLGAGAVTLAAGTTLAVTGATTIDNAIALTGAATIDNAAAVTASGIVSGTGPLTKAGAGTLTLSGTNTYTGATTVSAGTVLVTGTIATSSGVQVSSGGTLGGTGTVPAVSVLGGGSIAPGTSPGLLSTGNLAFTTGATFSAEVNGTTPGTDYDQAAVTGTVDVTGATLTVTLGFTPVAGTSFILIDNDLLDAVTGTFNGLAEGATFTVGGVTFTISYIGGDGNDVVITTAPPTVSINNVTAAEGNTGGTSFTFTVTLSVPSSQTVTVNYATAAAGTATAGTDFTSASGTVTFAPGETSKTVTVTVTGDTTVESDETFTVVLSNPTNATIATGTGTGTITNDDTASATVISIGAGNGTPGTVVPVDPVTGQKGTPILAFAGFGGEIRVASGDINGDGQADTITGAGAGATGGHVKVFSADGTLLRSFLAFDGFSGGVFVTSGDVNGDGFDDIIVSADAGATPHVKVFSGANGALLQSFFAYDIGFRGGVRVSVGDVNGDGFDDIVTGTGAGTTAHVKAFSGKDGALLRSFLAYDAGFSGGVYVAAGDLNGDGLDDIVTGSGPGAPGGHVKVFSGSDTSLIQSFLAYDAGFRGGVRVGVGSVNGSAAVLTGAGPGAGPHVKAFVNGVQVASLLAGDPTFSGGVYVG